MKKTIKELEENGFSKAEGYITTLKNEKKCLTIKLKSNPEMVFVYNGDRKLDDIGRPLGTPRRTFYDYDLQEILDYCDEYCRTNHEHEIVPIKSAEKVE